jgi:opacity protein-like surface antigen
LKHGNAIHFGGIKMNRKLLLLGFTIFFLSVAAVNAQDYNEFEIFGGFSFLKGDFEVDQPAADDISIDGVPLSAGDPIANEVLSLSDQMFKDATLYGFDVSFTYNINENFGIEADVSRYSKSETFPLSAAAVRLAPIYEDMAYAVNEEVIWTYFGEEVPFEDVPTSVPFSHYGSGTVDVDYSTLNILFGPKYTFRFNDRIIPFAHVLVGISRLKAETSGGYHVASSVEGTVQRMALDVAPEGTYLEDDYFGNSSFNMKLGKNSSSSTGLAFALGGGVDLKINDIFGIRLIQIDWIGARNKINYDAVVSEYVGSSMLELTESFYLPQYSFPIISADFEFERDPELYDEHDVEFSTPSSMLNHLRFSFGVTIGF